MKSILFAAMLALTFNQASAASFDCAKANSPSSKQICSEPELSKLDDELAVVFSEARSKLSVESQKLLIEGQRSWLRFHSRFCFFNGDAKPSDKKDSVACQIDEYRSRIETLKKTGSLVLGVKTFPYFQGWVDVNAKENYMHAEKGEFILFEGVSPTARALNQIIQPMVKRMNAGAPWVYHGVNVSYAGQDIALISTFLEGASYPPPVIYFSKTLNRQLKVSDVFKSPEWTLKAERIAVRDLKIRKLNDSIELFKSGFRPKPTDDFTYDIEADRFVIHFISDSGMYEDVKLAWKDFSEFLTPLGQRLSLISQK
jgi:uncharacterized protein YecT (DUF1311 family)